MIGMEQERKVPPLAHETFKDWFRKHPRKNLTGPPVLLWADTFNNFYHPDVAKAAVEVLEDAGFRVEVPMANLCCGRPLYDYGFLDMAERWLEQILTTLQPHIRDGVPMVVLEPSCCAVFRDELENLFPNNADAAKLRNQTFVLSEFLVNKAPDYKIKPLKRKALVHGHCHQKAIMGFKEESEILKKLELDYEIPEAGCCGMAGAFGFEEGDHFDVSVKCGERVLLPAVREADDEKLIIADGFSCQEQIAERTDRVPLHLAQVIQMAMHDEENKPGERPESHVIRERAAGNRAAYISAGLTAVGVVAAGYLAWKCFRRNDE
jgi:Fe-S oxidoreductase